MKNFVSLILFEILQHVLKSNSFKSVYIEGNEIFSIKFMIIRLSTKLNLVSTEHQ